MRGAALAAPGTCHAHCLRSEILLSARLISVSLFRLDVFRGVRSSSQPASEFL